MREAPTTLSAIEGVANTVIQMTGWGDRGYGSAGFGGQTKMMKDQGNDISVDDCIRDLEAFWTPHVAKFYT